MQNCSHDTSETSPSNGRNRSETASGIQVTAETTSEGQTSGIQATAETTSEGQTSGTKATEQADSSIYEMRPSCWTASCPKISTYLLPSCDFFHFHDTMEIGLCLEGSGTTTVEDTEYRFTAGDVCITLPYQRHKNESDRGTLSRWHIIQVDLLQLSESTGLITLKSVGLLQYDRIGLYGIIDRRRYPAVTEAVRRLIDEALHSDGVNSAQMGTVLVCELMLLLQRYSVGLPEYHIRRDRNPKILEPALLTVSRYIANAEQPTVARLAELCCLPLSTFRRLFVKAIKMSPKEYITLSALRQAQILLLSSELSILEISIRTGFHDISVFNRSFFKYTGVTPSAYRHGKIAHSRTPVTDRTNAADRTSDPDRTSDH